MPASDNKYFGSMKKCFLFSALGWPENKKPGKDVPNALHNMLNDAGYSEAGCYGSFNNSKVSRTAKRMERMEL